MINENIKKLFNKKTAIILIAAGIILIFLTEIIPTPVKKKPSAGSGISAENYIEGLEAKIKGIAEKIDKAGECEVMITASDGGEKTYAEEKKETSNENNDKTGSGEKNQKETQIEKNYVLVDDGNGDNLVLIKETLPKIKGVVVVCEGGNSTEVCNNITTAVSVLLGIPAKNICVYKKAG